MYFGDGVVGMVAVAPVVLFLVSYLVYTQAPKHRYRSPESERLPMLARRLCAQLLGLPRDQFDGALIVLSTAPRWLHFHQRKMCDRDARRRRFRIQRPAPRLWGMLTRNATSSNFRRD